MSVLPRKEEQKTDRRRKSIFLAAANVALLQYANDLFSSKYPNKDLPAAAGFTNACWMFSLATSLFVALVDTSVGYLLSWQAIALSMYKMNLRGAFAAPFGFLDKRFKYFIKKPAIVLPAEGTADPDLPPDESSTSKRFGHVLAAMGAPVVRWVKIGQRRGGNTATAEKNLIRAPRNEENARSGDAAEGTAVISDAANRNAETIEATERDDVIRTVNRSTGEVEMDATFARRLAEGNETLAESGEDDPPSVATNSESIYTESLDDARQHGVPSEYSIKRRLSVMVGALNFLVFLALFATILGVQLLAWVAQPVQSTWITTVTVAVAVVGLLILLMFIWSTRGMVTTSALARQLDWQYPGLYKDGGQRDEAKYRQYVELYEKMPPGTVPWEEDT